MAKRMFALIALLLFIQTVFAGNYRSRVEIQSEGSWTAVYKSSDNGLLITGSEDIKLLDAEAIRFKRPFTETSVAKIIKIDGTGKVSWTYRAHLSGFDLQDPVLSITQSGNICVLSKASDRNKGTSRHTQFSGLLSLVNASGASIWQAKILKREIKFADGSFGARGYATSDSGSGGCFIIGYSIRPPESKPILKLMKFTSAGKLESQGEFTGLPAGKYAIQNVPGDGFILAISSQKSNEYIRSVLSGHPVLDTNAGDIAILRVDNSGNLRWKKHLKGYKERRAIYSISKCQKNYLLAGFEEKNGKTYPWILKIDDDGNTIWEKNLFGKSRNSNSGPVDNIQPYKSNFLVSRQCGKGSCLTLINSEGSIIWDKKLFTNNTIESISLENGVAFALVENNRNYSKSLFELNLR